MCVLCGELLTKLHWTDQSIHANEDNVVMVGGDRQRENMRNRLARVAVINAICRYYGLEVKDWSGTKYIVSDRKGNAKIVQDLGEVWVAVEELIHRPADPLDPGLIAYLAQHSSIS